MADDDPSMGSYEEFFDGPSEEAMTVDRKRSPEKKTKVGFGHVSVEISIRDLKRAFRKAHPLNTAPELHQSWLLFWQAVQERRAS